MMPFVSRLKNLRLKKSSPELRIPPPAFDDSPGIQSPHSPTHDRFIPFVLPEMPPHPYSAAAAAAEQDGPLPAGTWSASRSPLKTGSALSSLAVGLTLDDGDIGRYPRAELPTSTSNSSMNESESGSGTDTDASLSRSASAHSALSDSSAWEASSCTSYGSSPASSPKKVAIPLPGGRPGGAPYPTGSGFGAYCEHEQEHDQDSAYGGISDSSWSLASSRIPSLVLDEGAMEDVLRKLEGVGVKHEEEEEHAKTKPRPYPQRRGHQRFSDAYDGIAKLPSLPKRSSSLGSTASSSGSITAFPTLSLEGESKRAPEVFSPRLTGSPFLASPDLGVQVFVTPPTPVAAATEEAFHTYILPSLGLGLHTQAESESEDAGGINLDEAFDGLAAAEDTNTSDVSGSGVDKSSRCYPARFRWPATLSSGPSGDLSASMPEPESDAFCYPAAFGFGGFGEMEQQSPAVDQHGWDGGDVAQVEESEIGLAF